MFSLVWWTFFTPHLLCCGNVAKRVSLLSLSPCLPWACFYFSFTFSQTSVQLLVVVSFRKCAALCWEVRYLALGYLSLFFSFFFFLICLLEAELSCARRTVHSAQLFFYVYKQTDHWTHVLHQFNLQKTQ